MEIMSFSFPSIYATNNSINRMLIGAQILLLRFCCATATLEISTRRMLKSPASVRDVIGISREITLIVFFSLEMRQCVFKATTRVVKIWSSSLRYAKLSIYSHRTPLLWRCADIAYLSAKWCGRSSKRNTNI